MYAQRLSSVLTELCLGCDVTTDSPAEMEERFESLRNYGHLPRGRKNRGQALSNGQVIAAVLGLVASRPSWAGHVATIITKLKPVGGPTDAFGTATTLADALSHLLSDKASLDNFLAVRISAAEAGTNSHGLAIASYERDGLRRQLSFVRNEMVSLLQPGADLQFEPELCRAPASREMTFNRNFFKKLVREIEKERKFPSPLTGDGSEYDREDSENERRRRLGATRSSNYLNIGVDNQVTWPREETLVEFGTHKLVLMPKTKESMPSIHIDLHGNKINLAEAMTVINRFLSLLTWHDNQFAIAQDGWAGNPVPVAVPRRNLAFTTTHHWFFNFQLPTSGETCRALALYREARNAEQNFMISYAVLNYFKIIEIRHPKGKDARDWISRKYSPQKDDPQDQHFREACGTEPPEKYIYEACRVAVAHASDKHPSDPDDENELYRLKSAAVVMHRLARLFITEELGMSD